MDKKIIVLFLLISSLITNCTIEKRLFQPGYHIEWKKRNPAESNDESVYSVSESKNEPTQSTMGFSPTEIDEKAIHSDSILGDEIPFVTAKMDSMVETGKNAAIKPIQTERILTPEKTADKQSTDTLEESEPRQFELFGIMSFGLYFTMLGLTVIGIVLNAYFVVIVAAFMLLLSLVFGIISVSTYRRNREKYRRNFFGYFGLIASAVTISLGLFILAFAFGFD